MAHDLMDHAAPNAHALPPTQTFRLVSGDTDRIVGLGQVTEDLRRHARGLHDVDLEQLAATIMRGLFDGLDVEEYRKLCVHAAATLTFQEPQHSKLAARLLHEHIEIEAASQHVHTFAEAIATGHEVGLVNSRVAERVRAHAAEYEALIQTERSDLFEFFGLRTLYDRYLLRHPHTRKVIEHPQHFFLRVAAGLSETPEDAAQLYNLMSSLSYLASSPTLFNSGTNHEQLSSCFLLDSPQDDLGSIYDCYRDIAMLSKFSGGIGLPYHRVRSRGALIRSTNGASQGIVPWLKTLDSSVAAVNQCFDPATLIYTADGPRAIRDVRVGDLVLGISGAYRQITEKFVYTQHEPMVALNIKHAIEPVRVTDGHPFYAIQGVPMEQSVRRTMGQLDRGKVKAEWIGAGQLQRGDYIAQVIPTEIVPVEGLTEEDAHMYGILLGDGHLSTDGYEWGVSGNPQRDAHLSFVQEYLSARGIHCWFNERGDSYLQIRWASGQGVMRDATTGRITGAGAPTLPFDRDDLYDAEGRKHIARRFAHLPHPQTLALLQGLIETDGCISRGKEITFTNTSMPLVEGLRYQLLRLGVPTSGQYREREQDHIGHRSDGSEVHFQGTVCAYDVRIPAHPPLAERLGCAPLTKQNWLIWQGCVFTRVRGVEPCEHTPFVCDLKVEGDVSYMTTSGLAHNGGRRKGACCVYLETWHPDIEEFLELRDNTGEESRRTYNLNLSNWIPDLFMQRVETDGMWSLFDPAAHPELCDLWGEAFEQAYTAAERAGTYARQLKARDLYARMVKTLAETGNGWMTFKDACNSKCNQTAKPGTIVHSSNLCTEIVEVTNAGETAVCNLGSLNLSRFVGLDGKIREEALADAVRVAVTFLDRVIDQNYYPTKQASNSNNRWRPVGLGMMGLQDVFFKLRIPFDAPEAQALSNRLQEFVYFHALKTSCALAQTKGKHDAFEETRAAQGVLQFDLWGVTPTMDGWDALKADIKQHGLRNSLLLAIAPTATIASIAGCYECIEPQVSNLFKRETLSGEFIQINRYLVRDLKQMGMWTPEIRDLIKQHNGSVQHIEALPGELRHLYRTAWELSQKTLIDLAAGRSPYIDQSQSLNLFMAAPTIGKLSSMYVYAWKKGLKTTYYLRSRPATEIRKTTTTSPAGNASVAYNRDPDAIACSLENPESCEACN